MNLLLGSLKSKTVWLGILTLLSANIEPIRDFVLAHISGQAAVTVMGVLTLVLRYLTTQSLAAKAGASPAA